MNDNEDARIHLMKAFEKLYAEGGMRGLSAAAVAKEAGYSRSSFYRVYDSVYDLLDILVLRAVPTREYRYLATHANTVTMEEFTNVILESLVRRTKLIRMLTKHSDDNDFYERFHLALKPAMLGQIKRVYILEDEEYEFMADYITAAKVRLLRYWALHELPPEEIAHLTRVTDAMFEGLLWERVNVASEAQQVGLPHERTPMSYFVEKYDWIANRYPGDGRSWYELLRNVEE